MNVFDIAGRAMSAQLVRLNATASNLANAGSVTGSEDKAYRAIRPVFSTVVEKPGVATVKVDNVVTSDTPATKRHEPGHPLADANGDVWEAGVDTSAELVEMVESARMYQNNVQVLQTAKSLILETIRLGK
ncbi:flagellar basal-body rod protein FlgC [Sphingobium sp. B2D3A]|nr:MULTISPECIES: flagellar basal body rod protein FlgC [Sphingobium]MCW2337708.1 flagellar basal-body rod protein FlgC [Sphingobium sp. B2D3A]MCW2350661.1 flagellar basal-body rod protein FlgC [Sphingobium sp. B12D2B]MCW2362077.1 flagellar basal-body rod protein FlgC [Sphingobium sp. B10D3B]MCW2366129.1 flagellar basal-body rod protein FlgC [Sphingobium sp. B7D2B]MCW2369763.1 flagellar basal-body rod protein FlgC [Sphingobium sp. B11D3D]